MKNKLHDFLKRDNCFFIHYASDGFYNGSNPAPNISCIILYNFKNHECLNFRLSEHLGNDLKNIKLAEEEIFSAFCSFLEEHPNINFVHWNMTAKGFGFNAIKAKAEEFGFDFSIPDSINLFDLASYVAYIAEKKLSIKQILWFNSLLVGNDYLDGKTEAQYFYKGLFDKIYNSVDLKVHGFVEITKLIQENKLKTEAPYQCNDGLTREERHKQALKLAETREKMINDIYEYNRKIQAQNERILDKYENMEPVYVEEERFFFFDFAHPFASLFANMFANLK